MRATSLTGILKHALLPVAAALALATAAYAAEGAASATTAAAGPTVEQRLAALEAYVTNADPTGGDAAVKAPTVGVAGPGHNAWMMISAALVFFMTLPGLAIFYGGLVRRKNVLSIVAQCMGITGVVTVLWWAVGYSLVFGTNFESGFLGGSEFFFLKGVGAAPNTNYAFWISQSTFAMFQLMFAIITPALLVGAVAERMKFSAMMLFTVGWMLVVYIPVAHMVWGATGIFNGLWNAAAPFPAIDFAGGTVVEMASGWSALVLCVILGRRLGHRKEPMPPHSMVLCVVGTGMLWVGWYGFNAGSALAADGIAANAFLTTTLAAAVASSTWAGIEYAAKGKPSVLGFCSGAVAGMVAITPAAGFVDATGAIIIGVLGGAVPYAAVVKVKEWLKYDDSLDTFGVHGVAGTVGMFMTAVLATPLVNANLLSEGYALKNGLAVKLGEVGELSLNRGGLISNQLVAMLVTFALSVVGTAAVAYAVRALIGLRASRDDERLGLDTSEHGEEGYIELD